MTLHESLITVASNAVPLVPLQMNKQTLCSLHLLDTKIRGDKKQDSSHRCGKEGAVHVVSDRSAEHPSVTTLKQLGNTKLAFSLFTILTTKCRSMLPRNWWTRLLAMWPTSRLQVRHRRQTCAVQAGSRVSAESDRLRDTAPCLSLCPFSRLSRRT